MRRLLCLFAIVMTYPGAAHAQGLPCVPYEMAKEHLAKNGAPVGAGVAPIAGKPDHILEVWQHEDGSWGVLVISPNGRACIVWHGHSWQAAAPAQPTGAPT